MDINKQKGVPKYVQLMNEIKRLIQNGEWVAGSQVPTERELAEKLNVSRNTVNSAYKELEVEGILVSSQGRGTFVTDSDAVIKRESRKDRLLKIIDMALEEASEIGFNIDEFLVIASQRVTDKKEMLRNVKVAFIECNREQLDHFSQELHAELGIRIVPLMLDDFRDKPELVSAQLTGTDLVLTTFFHLQEVKELMKVKGIEVLGMALDPQLQTIVKIARLHQGTKLGIVCLSEGFAAKIKSSLKNAGIDHLDISTTTTKDACSLENFIDKADAIVVSPTRLREVSTLNLKQKEIIEFRYSSDTGSVNAVKTALLELKRK